MDTASAMGLLNLIARGVGVAAELSALARRVVAGEKISDDELVAAQDAVDASCKAWDEQADNDK